MRSGRPCLHSALSRTVLHSARPFKVPSIGRRVDDLDALLLENDTGLAARNGRSSTPNVDLAGLSDVFCPGQRPPVASLVIIFPLVPNRADGDGLVVYDLE